MGRSPPVLGSNLLFSNILSVMDGCGVPMFCQNLLWLAHGFSIVFAEGMVHNKITSQCWKNFRPSYNVRQLTLVWWNPPFRFAAPAHLHTGAQPDQDDTHWSSNANVGKSGQRAWACLLLLIIVELRRSQGMVSSRSQNLKNNLFVREFGNKNNLKEMKKFYETKFIFSNFK